MRLINIVQRNLHHLNRSFALITLLLLAELFPPLVAAEETTGTRRLGFVLDNDIFYSTDRHYTNGVRVVWLPSQGAVPPMWAQKTARLIPWFPEQGKLLHGFAFGQSMFTPSDITEKNPPADDRPYTGWMYCSIGLGVEQAKQLDLFSLTFGMVGKASQAEFSQKLMHRLTGSDQPQGWDTQLGNEPGLVATYQRSWRGYATSSLIGAELDLTPHLGAALGNVYTYLSSGFTVRYGKRLPVDYGPPKVKPGLPGSGDFSPISDFDFYFFTEVEGRAVIRNIFLDGNTFRDSRSVDKKILVIEAQFGFVVAWSDFRFSYCHVLRTREFWTQQDDDDFGSIGLMINL